MCLSKILADFATTSTLMAGNVVVMIDKKGLILVLLIFSDCMKFVEDLTKILAYLLSLEESF